MNKKILSGIIAVLFLFTLTAFASTLPNFPMSIWGTVKNGTTSITSGTVQVFNGINKIGELSISSNGQYGGNTAFDQKLTLSQFTGSINYKLVTGGLTYNLASANITRFTSTCPVNTSISFVSDVCQYNLNLDSSAPVCSPASVTNGAVDSNTCVISCDTNYTLSGNTCNYVAPAPAPAPAPAATISSGGGGGYYPTHIKTTTKSNVKKTTTKSNVKKTTTKSNVKKTTITDTKKYLNKNLTNPKLKLLVNILAKKIAKKDIDFYTSFDKELKSEYSNIISSYKDLLITFDKYLIKKDKKLIPLIKKSYKGYLKYKSLKNIKSRYIDDKSKFYKTKYTKLKKPLDRFEKIIFTKLKRLNRFKIISNEKYNTSIKDYNNFVLYLSIYKQYKYKPAAKKALIYGRKIIRIYKNK